MRFASLRFGRHKEPLQESLTPTRLSPTYGISNGSGQSTQMARTGTHGEVAHKTTIQSLRAAPLPHVLVALEGRT